MRMGKKQRCDMDAGHKHTSHRQDKLEREKGGSPSPLKLPHQTDGRLIL